MHRKRRFARMRHDCRNAGGRTGGKRFWLGSRLYGNLSASGKPRAYKDKGDDRHYNRDGEVVQETELGSSVEKGERGQRMEKYEVSDTK
jgi:hypothetical protein